MGTGQFADDVVFHLQTGRCPTINTPLADTTVPAPFVILISPVDPIPVLVTMNQNRGVLVSHVCSNFMLVSCG